MLAKLRDEEEDEEDAREMDRVVVLKEAEVEWWELRDDDRTEQDDVEVVEVAWRLHRERRSLRYLRYLYSVFSLGAEEIQGRELVVGQACQGALQVATRIVAFYETAARQQVHSDYVWFLCTRQLAALHMQSFAARSRVMEEQHLAWLQLQESFEGSAGVERRCARGQAVLSRMAHAEWIELQLQICQDEEQALRKQFLSRCLATFEILYLETEEVKWRARWSIREFCSRAAVERDVGDVKFSWRCREAQQQLQNLEAIERLEILDEESREGALLGGHCEALSTRFQDFKKLFQHVEAEATGRVSLEVEEGQCFTFICGLHRVQHQEVAARLQIASTELEACHLQYRQELVQKRVAYHTGNLRTHQAFLASLTLQVDELRERKPMFGLLNLNHQKCLFSFEVLQRVRLQNKEKEQRQKFALQLRVQQAELIEARARQILMRVEDIERADVERLISQQFSTFLESWAEKCIEEVIAKEELLRGSVRLEERTAWAAIDGERRRDAPAARGGEAVPVHLLNFGAQCSPCQTLVGTFTFSQMLSDLGEEETFLGPEIRQQTPSSGCLATFRFSQTPDSLSQGVSVSINGLLKKRKTPKEPESKSSDVEILNVGTKLSNTPAEAAEARKKKVRKKKKEQVEDECRHARKLNLSDSRRNPGMESSQCLVDMGGTSSTLNETNGPTSLAGSSFSSPSPRSPAWPVRARCGSPLPRCPSPLGSAHLQWVPRPAIDALLDAASLDFSPGNQLKSTFPSKVLSAGRTQHSSGSGTSEELFGPACVFDLNELSTAPSRPDVFAGEDIHQLAPLRNIEGWLAGAQLSGSVLNGSLNGSLAPVRGTPPQEHRPASLVDAPSSLMFLDPDGDTGCLSPRTRLSPPFPSQEQGKLFTEEVAPPPGLTGAPRKPVVKVEKTEKPAKVHTDFCAEDLKSNLDARAEEVSRSKVKEREFFKEGQPSGERTGPLPPIRWRDRCHRGLRRAHQLQPLKKLEGEDLSAALGNLQAIATDGPTTTTTSV